MRNLNKKGLAGLLCAALAFSVVPNLSQAGSSGMSQYSGDGSSPYIQQARYYHHHHRGFNPGLAIFGAVAAGLLAAPYYESSDYCDYPDYYCSYDYPSYGGPYYGGHYYYHPHRHFRHRW